MSWIEHQREFYRGKPAPMTDADFQELDGLAVALLMGEQDPGEAFYARKQIMERALDIIAMLCWQAARIDALERATPDDSQKLIEAEAKLADLEERVESVLNILSAEQSA